MLFRSDGYLPIKAKPHVYNPKEGYFATANENVTPLDYPYLDAIGYNWSEPFRGDRVREALASGRKHNLMNMMQLQTDYLSIPARTLVPLLENIDISKDENLAQARQMLLDWDFKMTKNSIAAGIYRAWEGRLYSNVRELHTTAKERDVASIPTWRIIEWLLLPSSNFGEEPVQARNEVLVKSLKEAVYNLEKKLGKDMSQWQYGQLDYKHVIIRHPLSNAVKEDVRQKLDVGPAPRGGYSFTVNNTGGRDNQTHGASFKLIVDTGNWDHALGTNTPGQAGDPDDPHYRNLFDTWVNDQYFPVFYSREKVESVRDRVLNLNPR